MLHHHPLAGQQHAAQLRLDVLVGHGLAGALVQVVGPAGDDEAFDVAAGVVQVAVDAPEGGAITLARALQLGGQCKKRLGLAGSMR